MLRLSNWLKLLTPGIRIKRWLILLVTGATIIGLGVAMFFLDIYRHYPETPGANLLTLGGSPLLLRAGVAFVIGVVFIVLSLWRLNRSILAPLAIQSSDALDAIVEHHTQRRGLKIVAIGGGTGMPTLLRGLKTHTSNLTAIVTVADDGGSSGRLRRDLGVIPPGDFRNNIAALARDEALMTQLFQYRFGEGGLEGHSFGNLFITAMSSVTGSFENALTESSRVLAVRGQVMPSTLADVTLVAEMRHGADSSMQRVAGESVIPEMAGQIDRILLQPEDAPAYPEAVKAILAADLIVLGPGSLYTSILPNLLVHGIAQALQATRALTIYICNVATQRGETEGFGVRDHIEAIERHMGEGIIDVVVANDRFPTLPADANFEFVRLDGLDEMASGFSILTAPLIDKQRYWRHDPAQLADAVMRAAEGRERSR